MEIEKHMFVSSWKVKTFCGKALRLEPDTRIWLNLLMEEGVAEISGYTNPLVNISLYLKCSFFPQLVNFVNTSQLDQHEEVIMTGADTQGEGL